MPLSSFCVESGRWSQRGQESAGHFSNSNDQLATKELKLAAKYRNQQAEVWNRVAQAQEKLATNLKSSVKSNESASSLQLTLENKELLQAAGAYTKALSGIIEGDQDVIGYAFAINGKLNSADIYASSALFRKLWPKLLKAAAIEAIVDLVDEDFKPATA